MAAPLETLEIIKATKIERKKKRNSDFSQLKRYKKESDVCCEMKNSVLKALIDESLDRDDSVSYGTENGSACYDIDGEELSSGCSGQYEGPLASNPGKGSKNNDNGWCMGSKKKTTVVFFSIMAILVILLLTLLILNKAMSGKLDNSPADLIILNSIPYSVAIKDGRIQRIGSANWVNKKYDSKKTKLIDAKGVKNKHKYTQTNTTNTTIHFNLIRTHIHTHILYI